MSAFSSEITDAAMILGIHHRTLEKKEAEALHKEIFDHFQSELDSHCIFLWHKFKTQNKTSQYDPEGWKKLSTLIGDKPIIIFFDESDDSSCVYFPSAIHLTELLGECTGFVFYVAVPTTSQLYCFNDHDFLIEVKNVHYTHLIKKLSILK